MSLWPKFHQPRETAADRRKHGVSRPGLRCQGLDAMIGMCDDRQGRLHAMLCKTFKEVCILLLEKIGG
ncbi:MAG: hypothetical protein ACOVN4_03415, partial [Bosea sp. (in: a-proteobacteria)]